MRLIGSDQDNILLSIYTICPFRLMTAKETERQFLLLMTWKTNGTYPVWCYHRQWVRWNKCCKGNPKIRCR